MLAMVAWVAHVNQMKDCFDLYQLLPNDSLERNQCLKEGLSYYFIMSHMQFYDESDEFISPVLATLPANILDFYQLRRGYVEIVRHNRLEILYFQLPETCLPGGALDLSSSVHAKLLASDRYTQTLTHTHTQTHAHTCTHTHTISLSISLS